MNSEEQQTDRGLLHFLEQLSLQNSEGDGIVPLLGAGVSAPSGVPIIWEVEEYLNECIGRALGLDLLEGDDLKEAFAKNPRCLEDAFIHRRWRPASDSWPQYIQPTVFPDVLPRKLSMDAWKSRLLDFIDAANQLILRNDHSDIVERLRKERRVYESAVGAMADWRSALAFLSQLEESSDGTLSINAVNRDTIDSFYLHVVEGHTPTLAHRMLAALAPVLRINTILTTNFDNLIEEALRENGDNPDVFGVHREAEMPSFRSLGNEIAVIKMHGSRYGLRADFSLNAPPIERDKIQFLSYLARRQVTREEAIEAQRGGKKIDPKKHLLVAGVSASDERIVEFLDEAVHVTSERFRIFWICFTQRDMESAFKLQTRLARRRNGPEPMVIVRHQHLGHLFQQIHQRITNSMPSRGAAFPSPDRLPVPPQPTQHEEASKLVCQDRVDAFIKAIDERQADSDRLITIATTDSDKADFLAAGRAFEQLLDRTDHAMWIDLDEVSSCDSLFEMLMHAFLRKRGGTDWLPAITHTDRPFESARVRELRRLTSGGQRKWVVFLNASESIPASVAKGIADHGNWSDFTDLERLLWELCRPSSAGVETCPNLTIVLLYDKQVSSGLELRIDDVFKDAGLDRMRVPAFASPTEVQQDSYETLKNTVLDWVGRETCVVRDSWDHRRAHFLYALCNAGRPRLPVVLTLWIAHSKDSTTHERVEIVKKYLGGLEQRGLVRRKAGGVVWLHTQSREHMREIVGQLKVRGPKDEERELREVGVEIHHGLAEWYRKLFLASKDVQAAEESILHRCARSKLLLKFPETRWEQEAHDSDIGVAPTEKERKLFSLSLVAQDLSDIHQMLTIAFPIFLHDGFSRSACKSIEAIREAVVDIEVELERCELSDRDFNAGADAIRALVQHICILSIRINRGIALEVAENRVAFLRNAMLTYWSDTGEHKFKKRLQERRKFDGLILNSDIDAIASEFKPHAMEHSPNDAPWDTARKLEHRVFGATAGIASRNYEYSRHQIDMGYELVARFLGDSENELAALVGSGDSKYGYIYQIPKIFRRRLTSRVRSDAGGGEESSWKTPQEWRHLVIVIYRVLKLLQRDQQLCIERGRTILAAKNRKGKLGEAADQEIGRVGDYFDRALRIYRTGLELQRLLDRYSSPPTVEPRLSSGELYWYQSIFEDRQRLECQCAVAQSFQSQDFKKAHRRLREADAGLTLYKLPRNSMESGILELHRAEIYLHQTLWQETGCRSDGSVRTILGEKRDAIWRSFDTAKNDWHSLAAIALDHRRRQDDDAQNVLVSHLDDAWKSLCTCEKILKQSRKNVWWVTWMFELQIKVIELRLFCRVGSEDNNEQIPVFGLRDAPAGILTIADCLMENAIRLIRFDVYRLARILESYSRCIVGMRMILRAPQGVPKNEVSLLRKRVKRMQYICEKGKDDLRERLQYRVTDLMEPEHPSTKISEVVALYCSDVIEFAQTVINLEDPT